MPYKGEGIQLIYASYSWEMELNVDFDTSLDNVYAWNGMRDKEGKVDSLEVYLGNDEISR
jgi:hypothetical protein